MTDDEVMKLIEPLGSPDSFPTGLYWSCSFEDLKALIERAQQPDKARLDWLDNTNVKFKMGWQVSLAPAGNASLKSIIQLGGGPLRTIRHAIDEAMK